MAKTIAPDTEVQPRTAGYFTDAYVLRYLVQQAEARQSIFSWRQTEEGGYAASTERIDLHLEVIVERSGSRVVLEIADGQDRIKVSEPPTASWFGRRYATPEDAEVAQLLRSLQGAVRAQASRNEQDRELRLTARKQMMYRRLLFGADGAER